MLKTLWTAFVDVLRCSVKTGVLKNFICFTFHLLKSLFNKVAVPQLCNFIIKRLKHRCFAVKLVKFLRTPILKNDCERLFLFWKLQTKNFREEFQRKTPTSESLFKKFAGLKACTFIKSKLSTQLFFCEICEIFKNTASAAASKILYTILKEKAYPLHEN